MNLLKWNHFYSVFFTTRQLETSQLNDSAINGGHCLHHKPKNGPDSLRGPATVRPKGRGRACRDGDSSRAKRAGASTGLDPTAGKRAGDGVRHGQATP